MTVMYCNQRSRIQDYSDTTMVIVVMVVIQEYSDLQSTETTEIHGPGL